MASLRRSKPLSKAEINKSIIKQSQQLKKEQEARLISQDEEMKFMINSLIKTSKQKQNKMKDNVRPTLLKMVAEIEKKTSTINNFLRKTAEVGVAANSTEIDSTLLNQKAHLKPEVKYKKINVKSEKMYTETLNVFKSDQFQEYSISQRLKRSAGSKSPSYPKPTSPKKRIQSPIIKLKRYQVPRPKLQTVPSSTHTLTLGHAPKSIRNCKQPIAKHKQEQTSSSQPHVIPSSKQKLAPSSTHKSSPNSRQVLTKSYVQQSRQKSKQDQSSNPKRRQVTGVKVTVAPSTKRLSKQGNEHTIVKK